ncbi:hypothetical protein [Marivita sp. S2033]|uniref:hypothetical protein n=1 Tax=Marivita sp. S2033 TaxID=3373187 RepID=UPI003981F30F
MITHTRFSLAVATFAALGACGVSGILRVDQDRYSNGFALLRSTTILGPPEEDSIGEIRPPVRITDATPFDMGRAVLIGDRAEFLTDPNHTVPSRYQIVWTGARTSVSDAVNNIILRDDDGREALRIQYTLNRIDAIWADDVGLAPGTLNASLPHEVRIILYMTGVKRADVTATRDGEVLFQRTGIELIDSGFSRLDAVEVRSQTDYFMRDLVATTLGN